MSVLRIKMLIQCFAFVLAICLLASSEMKCIDISESFTKLLDNYKDANTFSKDVYFGLNLAFSILSGCRQCQANDKDRNEFYWKTLKYRKLLRSGGRTRNVLLYEEIILQSTVDFERWEHSIKYRHLDTNRFKANYSFYDYEWIVDRGFPNHFDSDRCLAQIGSTRSCVISSDCISMMTSSEPSYGYHKTHQVLFLILMWLKGCSGHLPIDQPFHFLINTKCSDIYSERNILSIQGVPDNYRDLFIEQSLFCGLLGFSEFLEESAIKYVPTWQTESGCFSDGSNSTSSCMNHMTSLGVAFYANLIAIECSQSKC